jgi:hypothetical protein
MLLRASERDSSTGNAVLLLVAHTPAACMLTTTFWPRPERWVSRCASRLATAALEPAWKHACGTLTCRGGWPGPPIIAIISPAAQPTMSAA